jgi:hypothetical protein
MDVSASCWNLSLAKDPLRLAISKSDIVFVGIVDTVIKKTIRSRGEEESLQGVSAVLGVEDVLKGDLESEVTVKGEASIDCQCAYDFEVGVKYLVMASQSNQGYILHWCGYVRPVTDDSSLVEEARHIIESNL